MAVGDDGTVLANSLKVGIINRNNLESRYYKYASTIGITLSTGGALKSRKYF